jgi:hypothetical protein
MSVFSMLDYLLAMVQFCICYSITVLIGIMFLHMEVCNDLKFNFYIYSMVLTVFDAKS